MPLSSWGTAAVSKFSKPFAYLQSVRERYAAERKNRQPATVR